MKKKWDREEDSVSLVITPHESVLIEIALQCRLAIVNHMLGVDAHIEVLKDYAQEQMDIEVMLEAIRSFKQ